MKFLKQRFESDSITEQVMFMLIGLLFMFPIFKQSIHSLFLILLGTATMVNAWRHKKAFFDKRLWFFFIPFFIVLTDTILRGGIFDSINKTLFFVFFPAIFCNIPNRFFSDKNINLYSRILQVSAMFVCTSYVVQFFIDYDYADLFTFHYNVPKFRHYIYFEMKYFAIHPTYFTFVLTYCIVVSLKKIVENRIGIDVLLLFLYIVFSIFLMTKLNLIFQFGVVFCFVFFKSGINHLKKTIILISLVVISISTVVYMPSLLNRFTEVIKSINKKPEGMAFDSTNIRRAIYNCDLELVKKNYLLGVGFNNIQERLNDCYSANYDSQFYKEKNYLSHNYFFYVFISSGIVGFYAVLIFFLYLFKLVTQISKFIVFVVVLNVFLMCFIEDFFYRQFGLFSFLLLFFTHYKNNLENQKNNSVRDNKFKLS